MKEQISFTLAQFPEHPKRLTFALPHDPEKRAHSVRANGLAFFRALDKELRGRIQFRETFDGQHGGQCGQFFIGEETDTWATELAKLDAKVRTEHIHEMDNATLAAFIREHPDNQKAIAETLARILCTS